MLPILEAPAIRERAMPVSLELYHRLGELALISEKTELLDGVIIEDAQDPAARLSDHGAVPPT